MKKSALLLVTLVFLLGSCASMDKESLARIDQAALVSLYCEKMIKAPDFKGDLADMGKILQSPSFDLKPVITSLTDDFFGRYAKDLPFAIVDEGKVIDSPAYKRLLAEKSWDAFFYAAPDDYAVIYPGDSETMLDAIEDVPEADAAISVHANFELHKDGIEVLGMGNARIRCDLHFVVVNRSGRTVVENYVSEASDTPVTYLLGGLFDASKLSSMCSEAATKSSRSLLRWIAKELRS